MKKLYTYDKRQARLRVQNIKMIRRKKSNVPPNAMSFYRSKTLLQPMVAYAKPKRAAVKGRP